MNLFSFLLILILGIAIGLYLSHSGQWPSPGRSETPQAAEAPAENKPPADTRFVFVDSPELTASSQPPPPPQAPPTFRYKLHQDRIYNLHNPERPIDRYYFREQLEAARAQGAVAVFSYDDTVTGLFVEALKRELRETGVRYSGLD